LCEKVITMNYTKYVYLYIINAFTNAFFVTTNGSNYYSNYDAHEKTEQKMAAAVPPACCITSARALIDLLDNATLYDKYSAPTHGMGGFNSCLSIFSRQIFWS
jgi:hypothetical protein